MRDIQPGHKKGVQVEFYGLTAINSDGWAFEVWISCMCIHLLIFVGWLIWKHGYGCFLNVSVVGLPVYWMVERGEDGQMVGVVCVWLRGAMAWSSMHFMLLHDLSSLIKVILCHVTMRNCRGIRRLVLELRHLWCWRDKHIRIGLGWLSRRDWDHNHVRRSRHQVNAELLDSPWWLSSAPTTYHASLSTSDPSRAMDILYRPSLNKRYMQRKSWWLLLPCDP